MSEAHGIIMVITVTGPCAYFSRLVRRYSSSGSFVWSETMRVQQQGQQGKCRKCRIVALFRNFLSGGGDFQKSYCVYRRFFMFLRPGGHDDGAAACDASQL